MLPIMLDIEQHKSNINYNEQIEIKQIFNDVATVKCESCGDEFIPYSEGHVCCNTCHYKAVKKVCGVAK
jgi:Zn finger protein HypA/HybF involved in hydrogenase expression